MTAVDNKEVTHKWFWDLEVLQAIGGAGIHLQISQWLFKAVKLISIYPSSTEFSHLHDVENQILLNLLDLRVQHCYCC
jgi:hypothetical protein